MDTKQKRTRQRRGEKVKPNLKGKELYEYGGLWLHSTDNYAEEWRQKGRLLVPPIEAFHKQFIILKTLGLERHVEFPMLILFVAGEKP